jgi:hypothetical protein
VEPSSDADDSKEDPVAVNPVVAAHLKEARRELIEAREALDRDIAQLDSMLHGYAGDSPATPRAGATASVSRGPAPAMKDAIVEHLKTEDRDFSTHEVAVALRERYGWELSSTRSQISKMGKSGEVFQVRRGVYRASATASLPTDTSGPADAGPEAGVSPTGTGGEADAQDHNQDRTAERADPGDRTGAPVALGYQ